LCNTRLRDRDLLTDCDALARWCQEAGLSEQRPSVSRRDLLDAQALRDGLRMALLAADRTLVAEIVGAWLDSAPGRLCVEPETLTPRFTPGAQTCHCLLVAPALDALELARETPGRVRECAAPDCNVIYVDTSRNRSRRWCSMERCGARAKASAYYRRHHPLEGL
jgi:predicted RNA-binding Zn ribbon-like protein